MSALGASRPKRNFLTDISEESQLGVKSESYNSDQGLCLTGGD